MKLETESIRQCFQEELVSGLLRGVQMSLQPVFIHSFIHSEMLRGLLQTRPRLDTGNRYHSPRG